MRNTFFESLHLNRTLATWRHHFDTEHVLGDLADFGDDQVRGAVAGKGLADTRESGADVRTPWRTSSGVCGGDEGDEQGRVGAAREVELSRRGWELEILENRHFGGALLLAIRGN